MNTFIRRLSADVPLLEGSTLARLAGMDVTPGDLQLAEHPSMKRLRDACATQVEKRGNVCIVPVQGTLAANPDPYEQAFMNVEDSRRVRQMIEACAQDSECKGVLLRIDSPGGMLMGGPEIADAVIECRRMKPLLAHIGGLGASLGYMIASQATEVVADRSSVVGSIGVIASVTDYTGLLEKLGLRIEYFTNKEAKFKAVGAPGTSLTPEHREHLQAQVDSAFSLFKLAVQSVRPQVKDDAMRGQTFRGEEAKKLGLIDRIGSESFALSVLGEHMRRGSR
jgi:signal peptide peptidase SppA